MKKFFTMLFCLMAIALNVSAQELINGVYETKEIVEYNNVCASKLYEHSMLAISDMVGARQNSKFNIDVQDNENKTIVFKCSDFLGFYKKFSSAGYNVYADMTIRIRCKDNKIQYTITVPSLTLVWISGDKETIPLSHIIPTWTHRGRLYYTEKPSVKYVTHIPTSVKSLIDILKKKTINNSDDDF